MNKIILALGGNMGNVTSIFAQALLQLEDSIECIDVASSYSSRSLLNDGQKDYINTVCTGLTKLSPQDLLAKLKEIECEFGRIDSGHWQARPLDIDIIDYNGQIIAEAGLDIPHLQMAKRGFVLLPLKELRPDYVDPRSKKNIDTLIAELTDTQATRKLI
ncbi:MAG: 2-amino-4-hydroxy-6-hydroxymethyldihydropteridine diphosphokinase [Deferribacteraceae bacterium]|nr:2-amino-4-hydroxy-6-hydroxymethyldihydropteridine diphosphokinase [Deferribacteraceae bacterium]